MFNLHYNFVASNVCDISKWRLEVENEMLLCMFNEFMSGYIKVYNLYDVELWSKKCTVVLDKNREVIKIDGGMQVWQVCRYGRYVGMVWGKNGTDI